MTTAERARRILRATLEARELMIEWREQQVAQLQAMLETMAGEFGAEIERLANADGTLPLSAVDLLNRYIEQRMGTFDSAFRRVLMDGLQRSASMGAGECAGHDDVARPCAGRERPQRDESRGHLTFPRTSHLGACNCSTA